MQTIKSDNNIYSPDSKHSTYFYDKLMKEIKRLNRRLDKSEATIKKLRTENHALRKENKALKEENQKLRSIIANNSSNSSLPPSSDQKPSKEKSPNEYNSRIKTHNKPGGQLGRLGTTLTRKAVKKLLKNKHVEHRIIYSSSLSLIDRYLPYKHKSYYEIDLKIIPIVTEYRIPVNMSLPDNLSLRLKSGVCYGNTMRTIAVQLNSIHSVSISRTKDFLNDLIGSSIGSAFSISDGTIYNFISDFADICNNSGTISNIASSLAEHKILWTDATNISVGGGQAFIRNQSNPYAVLYCPMAKKNKVSIGNSGILADYKGILVHDHETTLYNFGIDHAECNAHIMRYLQKVTEETGNAWAKEMQNLLARLNQYKTSLIEQDIHSIAPDELQTYYDEYTRIIKNGIIQNKISTKPKYAKRNELDLLKRMEKYQYNHLLFLRDFDVSFTNNMSEQDLRKCKNKQKISGGFRKESGQKNYCDIMSVIETMKRRGINTFSGIKRMLAGEVVIGE